MTIMEKKNSKEKVKNLKQFVQSQIPMNQLKEVKGGFIADADL